MNLMYSKRLLLYSSAGLALLNVSLFADQIGFGSGASLGKAQITGGLAGLLMILLGVACPRRVPAAAPPPSKPRLSAKKKLLFSSLCVVCTTILLVSGACLVKSYRFYSSLSSSMRGWKGAPHKADVMLGYAAKPNGEGFHTFPIGPDIPMRYDSAGFRVPVAASPGDDGKQRPVIMFLGCSFTYGDACLAEDTFPEQIANAVGGTCLNAGKCSYGLSQMVLLSQELTPRFKPDYVVVQYSPWLVNRAMTPFMPTYFGKIPGPYYARNDNGELSIARPVFETMLYELPFDDFKGESRSGFPAFCARVAIPLFAHDLWGMTCYRIKRTLGMVPAPTKNREEVIRSAYSSMNVACQENDARMIVLALGKSADPMEVPAEIVKLDLQVVNAHQALLDRLRGQEYDNLYKHWRGKPPRIVDGHPNGHAHAIIAEELAGAIQDSR